MDSHPENDYFSISELSQVEENTRCEFFVLRYENSANFSTNIQN